jgi:hypothetical protein
MPTRTLCGFCCLFVGLLAGCRAGQLSVDQREMRAALLQMYEDQVMDNLIRARRDLPFIHLDYSNVTGTITDSGSATVGGSRSVTHTSFARNAAEGAGPGVTSFSPDRAVVGVFNYNGTGSQTNQLTITAQPYTASDRVYKAYLAFAKDDKLLCEGKEGEKPPPDAHIWRSFGKQCYWVPKSAARPFLELYLATTVSRQAAAADIPTSYETTFLSVVGQAKPIDGNLGMEAVIQLKDKLPNDSGNLVIRVKGVLLPGMIARFEG